MAPSPPHCADTETPPGRIGLSHAAVEKAPAESFHGGTLGEGMRAAITAVRSGFKEMIEAWRAT